MQEDPVFYVLFFLCFQYGKEGRLWQLHVSHHLHPLLSFLLLFQKLALAGDVAAVALGQHVLAQGVHRLTGDNLASDGTLDGNLELLAGNLLLQLGTDMAGTVIGVPLEGELGQCIHRLAIDEDVNLYQLRGLVADEVIVKGGIATAVAFEPVVEVEEHLRQGHLVGDFHPLLVQILHVGLDTTLFRAQGHDGPQIGGGGDDGRPDVGLLGSGNASLVRIVGGIVDVFLLPAGKLHQIAH